MKKLFTLRQERDYNNFVDVTEEDKSPLQKKQEIMTEMEKKKRMAENYAINSKKTPRTARMAFARSQRRSLIVLDPKFKNEMTICID